MSDFRDLARDTMHRRRFEHLLYLAAQRGDADLVAERLSWGIDPNCTFAKNRTSLIANVRGSCPSLATVQALLNAGAHPSLSDESGLTPLDYARRKLIRLADRPRQPPRKSPSLDENDQLLLGPAEQNHLDNLRRESPEGGAEMARIYWKERLRAARRVLNDPQQLEAIVALLETEHGQS